MTERGTLWRHDAGVRGGELVNAVHLWTLTAKMIAVNVLVDVTRDIRPDGGRHSGGVPHQLTLDLPRIDPKGGPRTRFSLTEVTVHHSFTDRCRLPLATLDFIHVLTPAPGGTVITHRVVMNGPLTFIFRRLMGSGIERGLPIAVQSLARHAEVGSQA